MLRVAVCVSGGGTNLQAIIDAVTSGKISNTEIVQVLSNNPGAYALKRARQAKIPAVCVSRADHPDKEEYNQILLETLQSAKPDLIVLAGFLVVIPAAIVRAFPNRIINIHPSLIPSFCGSGYYGLKVHEGVLNRGVQVTGATVHFVDEGTDSGPIILQKPVAVHADDDAKSLQLRVMEEAEWKILPKAIDLIANDKVRVKGRRVTIDERLDIFSL